MRRSLYEEPAEFGFELVDELDGSETYEYDVVVLYRETATGLLWWAAAKGCSCGSRSEDIASRSDLQPVRADEAALRAAVADCGQYDTWSEGLPARRVEFLAKASPQLRRADA